MKIFKPFMALILVELLLALSAGGTIAQGPPNSAIELELVAEVPPSDSLKVDYINAMQVLDSNPNEIVFVTQNQGATCGGGTPASAWKMTLDPDTGDLVSLVLKQSLSQIQNARGALFESSDGTLFTGGGWCLYKPPYYSTDGGETWQTADAGPVHPPNSTYSFVEFNGDVYAGTGYEPWHGQIYRWLGDGNWELILDIAPPRSIVGTMVVYENQLFVGSHIYGWGGSGCESSVPVYVSTDGDTFNATTGIPPCYSVSDLLVVGDQLVARVQNYFDSTERYMYRWNNDLGEWEEIGMYNLGYSVPHLVSQDGVVYAYGQAPGDTSAGIYQSVDTGQTWQQIVVLENPDASTMTIHNGTLYLGTRHDASNIAYIYRIKLVTEVEIDIKPGSDPNSINCNNENEVIAVAILTTDGFDATTVDHTTVTFEGANETHVDKKNREPRRHEEDVDYDEDTDLVFHFRLGDTDLACDSTEGTLTGETFDGQAIEGTDAVRMIDRGGGKP